MIPKVTPRRQLTVGVAGTTLCLGLVLSVSILLDTAPCPGKEGQTPFEYYKVNLNGAVAAAVAPDGSRLAAIVDKDSAEWLGTKVPAVNYLQIWDFRTQRLLLELRARTWNISPNDRRGATEALFPKHLAYTSDGRELVYCDGTNAHAFDTAYYHELRTFPLTPTTDAGPLWQVQRMSISPHGEKIAVTEIELDKDFWPLSGVVLSVYSLDSGALVYTQNFNSARTSGALAWSPDGEHLAVSLSPVDVDDLDSLLKFSDVRIVSNVAVTVQIQSGYQQNWAHGRLLTGDLAGDVAFLADGSLVTVAGGPALGPGRKDDLRVWDAATGKLLRQIPSPPDGAHYHVKVSQDGRILLSYIGKDHFYGDSVEPAQQQFRLWDTTTWETVFTSPPIPIVRPHSLPHDLANSASSLRFALSSDGNVVMVWWSRGEGPVQVYERQ